MADTRTNGAPPAVQLKELAALDPVLTVEQVADVLKIGKNFAYDLLRTNRIKGVKVGGHYRIPRKSLEQFLGVDEADLLNARERRRAEVDALLARYRLAADECSRVTARLLELGVALAEPAPRP
jgi:excisionase family DNA binding protein